MEDLNRDFKGVWIPKEIWIDTRLNALEKVILAEIDSLDNGERGCWASNKYIADFCQCSERKVSEAISKLKGIGYLKVKSFDGRTREIRSAIYSCVAASQNLQLRQAENAEQHSRNCEADTQIMREINTVNNQLNKLVIKDDAFDNAPDKPAPRTRFVKPTLEEVTDYCKQRKNNVDPGRFLDYYESNGWKVGRNPMKDWKAAVRSWERNSYGRSDQNKRDTGAHWDDLNGIL